MNKHASLIILVAYALVVTWLSLRPAGIGALGSYDKLAHFFTYAVFAILAYRLGLARRAFFLSALAIVFYSGLLEFAQSFVPGRMMSGLDLLANATGVLLGAAFSLLFSRFTSES